MPQIHKLTDLNIAESFVQVNLIKGYKYVDKAGEIVNILHEGNKPPKFTMDLGGLSIFNPSGKAEELRISSTNIWAHFLDPNSFEEVESFFMKKYEEVIEILDAKEISRTGWRNFFIYESTPKNVDNILGTFSPIEKIKFGGGIFTTKIQDTSLMINIKKITNKENKNPGILIDIDAFRNYETPLSSKEASGEFLSIKNDFRSEEMLNLINAILSE